MITAIESKHNTTLRHLARLNREKKYRQGAGEMVCEGWKMLGEALSSGVTVKTVLQRTGDAPDSGLIAQAEAQGARLFEAEASLFAQASDVETPQGVIFSCVPPKRRADDLPETLSGAILLDGVQDPGNVGTVWRTADAFGAAGLFLLPGCAEPFAPKTVRATMGACFRLPVWEGTLEDLTGLLARSAVSLYAAALRDDTEDIRSVPLGSAAVVIGSEGQGLTDETIAACNSTVRIPMTDRVESLNAGIAGSILLWHFREESL